MDRAGILCAHDKGMLLEFSRRSVEHLSGRSILFLPLPFFHAYMDANVGKEIEKDRLIIEHAAAAFDAGTGICDEDVEDIFEKTKAVDKKFLRKVSIPSLSIKVRYDDISEIRKQRIKYLAGKVVDILHVWDDDATFSDAVKKTCTDKLFREAVVRILHLYNLETRMLSRSIRLFAPLHSAVEAFADALFDVMEEVTEEMADECTKKIFKGAPLHAEA